MIRASGDDGLVGDPGILVKIAAIANDINIRAREDQDILRIACHDHTVNGAQLGHRDGDSPTLPQNIEDVERDGEDKQGNRELE